MFEEVFYKNTLNWKDFEPPILEIYAHVVSNYLCKVFIRDKYLGTSEKTDSNMKKGSLHFFLGEAKLDSLYTFS